MNIVDKAIETQLRNIQTRTGRTLDELYALLRASGLEKHGEQRDMLKRDLGMGHGDANTLVHMFRQQASGTAAAAGTTAEPAGAVASRAAAEAGDPIDGIYTGAKAVLRPIHEAVMAGIHGFGEFEIAPKKTYLSLRRKKQFATLGPATNTRVEVGLNMKDIEATDRLIAYPPGGMCQYKVRLADASEVDAELLAWIRRAFDSAG